MFFLKFQNIKLGAGIIMNFLQTLDQIIITVPAIQAKLFAHKNTCEVAEKSAWLAFDIGTCALGIGGAKILFTAGNWLRKAIVISDLIGSSAGIALQLADNDAISPALRSKIQIASLILSLPQLASCIPKVNRLITDLDAAILARRLPNSTTIEKEAADLLEEAKKKLSSGILKSGLLDRLDNLNLNTIKNVLASFDDVTKLRFLDDFVSVSDDALRALNENAGLINYWRTNGAIIKNRAYPEIVKKTWDESKSAILARNHPTEVKILDEIEKQFNIKPLTNNQPVMAGAYCEELEQFGGSVFVKYNLSPVEKASFNYAALDPVIKDHLDYLNLIRLDARSGGKIYEKLYTGVTFDKLIAAGEAASHAEILALNEVIKAMKLKGLYNGPSDFSKIKIMVRGKGDWGNMCRCPHCYHLSNGVNMIGNF